MSKKFNIDPAEMFISKPAAETPAQPVKEDIQEEPQKTAIKIVVEPAEPTKSKRLQLLVTPETKDKLQRVAKENNMSVNALCNYLFDQL